MIEKEYRIVMPVSVEEYRCAQVYMTAQTSLGEAENVDGAGVEVLVNRPGKHPKLGAAQYTKKKFHIDKRFPSWLRMVAPKSGSHLIEESWNAFPHTLTEVTFPVLSSFRITVESHHRPDRGEGNPHGIGATARKRCEVVEIDIAQPSSSSTKDQDSSTHRGDDSEEDLSDFRSRCGRGPLRGQWKKVVQPVMCAYKRVTCEIQLWGMQNKIENFMHTYERALFHKANRNTFCWIDEWYGLGMEELRAFEAAVNERINLITEIKLKHGDHRCAARVNDLPRLRALDFQRDDGQKGIQTSQEMGSPSGDTVWPEGHEHVLNNMQARAEGAAKRSLFRRSKGRSGKVSDDSATADAQCEVEGNERKARSVSPAALARTSTGTGGGVQARMGCSDVPESSQVSDLNAALTHKNGIVVTPSKTKTQLKSEIQDGPMGWHREAKNGAPQSGNGKEENSSPEPRPPTQLGAASKDRISINISKPDAGPVTEQAEEQKGVLTTPKRLGSAVSEDRHTVIHIPKACAAQGSAVARADATALGPCTSSPEQHLREPIGGERDMQVNEIGEEVKAARPRQGDSSVAEKAQKISEEEHLCGCGILFEIFESQLRISHLVDGGPASASGMLEVGDILTSIDMQDVTRLDICRIAPLLLGPERSSVALGFQRLGAGADVVVLQRRPYPTTLLSDNSRASPLGRKRILSLRGVSRSATPSRTPTLTASPRTETPLSGGISNCKGTAALSSDQESFLGGTVDTALHKIDDLVQGPSLTESQAQQSDQDLSPLASWRAINTAQQLASAGRAARQSVEGRKAQQQQRQEVAIARGTSSSAHPSKSYPFRNVVRWNRDQRAPKRREEKCSISECCKVGMYTFGIGKQETRVCSIECKLVLLQRAHDQEPGCSDPYGAESSCSALSEGWELRADAQGREYYLDHNTCTSYWKKPV